MNAILEKCKSKAGTLSYVVIIVIFGLPLWWHTTTVYRANLPYSTIDQLSNLKAIKQKVYVLLISEDARSVHKLGPQLQSIFQNSALYDVEMSARVPSTKEVDEMTSVSSLADLDVSLGVQLSEQSDGWVILLEVPSTLLQNMQSSVLGNQRVVYFSQPAKVDAVVSTVMDVMLAEYSLHQLWKYSQVAGRHKNSVASDLARKKSTGSIDLQLSLIVPEPDMVSVTWNIKSAVEAYIKPFLNKFPLKVSVNSQVLYLTSLKLDQPRDNGMNVTGEQIGVALNHVESLLNSQSSVNPAINLIIYIPKIDQSPLRLSDSDKFSFVVPRWGGVFIYNYISPGVPENAFKFPTKMDLDMELITGIWLGQLRTLLGVSNVGEGQALPLTSEGVRLWELDFQYRYRSQENILETKSTLQSLSSLLEQISNIVIREDIARRVENALSSIKSSIDLLEVGNLVEGHAASQQAIQQSEAAFFDPSLLALLYFPDDQKYAIYVPYFVPVGLPILLSLKSMVKLFRKREKTD